MSRIGEGLKLDADMLAAIDRTLRAMAECRVDARARGYKKGCAGEGEVVCPACGGTVRYAVVARNGHMRGKCSTEGCVSWLE